METPARPAWLTYRRFAGFTAGLTATLMALGVYTAATGSGLACSAQWPLCDNGLLPQTVPSFVEWFHRLVAMVTGFFIVGTALWAWRGPVSRRGRVAATLAAVLLPLQISIGAVTVTLNGLLPAGYSPPTQGAHLAVALTIFASLVLTTLAASPPDRPLRRARNALVGALALVPVAVLLSRVPGLVAYAPAAQAGFYLVSLALLAALVAATVRLGRVDAGAPRALSGLALLAHLGVLLLGRDLVLYTPTVRTVNAGLFVLTGVAAALAAWLTARRLDVGPDRRSGVASGD